MKGSQLGIHPLLPDVDERPTTWSVRVIPELNTYHVGDAIKFMRSLPKGSVDGIATSPPYNKAFRNRGGHKSNWPNSKLMAENYAGFDDDLPPQKYVRWQRRFLREAQRLVGEEGVILYNIGRSIKNLGEDRREKIIKDFPVRQTIVWNRGSSNNQGGKRPTILPPIYEMIYIIAGKKWRIPEKYLSEMRKWGDVWHIKFETGNPHPAPFPLELAERMVKMIDGVVLDPFAGSGTIGIAAERLGYSYYLNDKTKEYKDMFEKRLSSERSMRNGIQD